MEVTYLDNAIVVLGVLAEHDGTLAIRAEGGHEVRLQNCPKLEREIEDCRLKLKILQLLEPSNPTSQMICRLGIKLVVSFIRSGLQYVQQQQQLFDYSTNAMLPIYIIHVTRVNQDHLHSVIQFALDRKEPGSYFCMQYYEIPHNTM